VPGERAEQLDVLLGRVVALPAVLADRDHLEQPARLDLGPVVGEFSRARPRHLDRQPLADLVVDVLDLTEERITPVGEHVPLRPDGQVSAGTQRVPGQVVPDRGVDPVPGGGREDQAHRLRGPPFLEPPLDDLHREPGQVPAGDGGQLRAELDARNAEAPPGQRESRLARGTAHLEQMVAGRDRGQGDQVIEEAFRVVGAGPVVALGDLIEGLPEPLALTPARHRASIPPTRAGRRGGHEPRRPAIVSWSYRKG
jgi:hypothetical protein